MALHRMSFCTALALLLFAGAWAQSSDQKELPSAPSAAKEPSQPEKRVPTPPPAPAPRVTSIQELVPSGQGKPQPPPPPKTSDPKQSPATAETETSGAASDGDESDAKPQPPQPPSSDDIDNSLTTIVRTVNEVNVVFTVTDKHGRYVKDLKKDDFKVLDDSKPALAIRAFRNETDLPLQVGLLVDASNSVRDRFKFEQEAAIEFLNQIVRPSYDKAFVIGFDTTPEITQDFTDNTELLSRGVHSLRAGGGTAMYDALYFACRD